MGQANKSEQPHGRLGALAGFSGSGVRWQQRARKRLAELYDNDPELIISTTAAIQSGQVRTLVPVERLAQLTEDYASYWLLQRLSGALPPTQAQQNDLWEKTASLEHFRAFDLVHAAAGWDVLTPRLGEQRDTLLMRFAGGMFVSELQEFLGYIPPAEKFAALAARNRFGMTAMHATAEVGARGAVRTLTDAGAAVDATMRLEVADVKADVTIAHLAVMHGRIEQTVELVHSHPKLFAPSAQLDYTPMETGQMHVEHMLEGYGRSQFRNFVVSAFTAMASKGTLQAVSQIPLEQESSLKVHCNNIMRAVNLAAYAQHKPLPYPEHMEVLTQLSQVRAPAPMAVN